MDGVSLAESLLYKDCDELQRLIKTCSVLDNRGSENAINPPTNEGEHIFPASEGPQEFLNDSFMPTGRSAKFSNFAAFINNSEKIQQNSQEIRSFFDDAANTKISPSSVSGSQDNQVGCAQTANAIFRRNNQGHQSNSFYGAENETGLPIAEKIQESYLHTNSAASDPCTQQQTMVSSFKLNAALPITSCDFPSAGSQCATLFDCVSPKSVESVASKSQLPLSQCSPTGFSNGRTNQIKQNSNSMSMACTVNGMFSLGSYSENTTKVAKFGAAVSPGRSSQLFHNNEIGGNKQGKCPQQFENGSTNVLGIKTDTASKNVSYYEQKESASEASRIWTEMQSSEGLILQKSNVHPLIIGLSSSTPFLLPKPDCSSYPSQGLSKSTQHNSTGCRDYSKLLRFPGKVQCGNNGALLSGGIGSFQGIRSRVVSEKNAEVSKNTDHVLKQIPSLKSVENLELPGFLMKLPNLSPKSTMGSFLPYNQMREQHNQLSDEVDKIISCLFLHSKNMGLFSVHQTGTNQREDAQNWLENEYLALHNTYEKINNLVSLLDKPRSGSVPRVVFKVLGELFLSIRKLTATTCNPTDSRSTRERNPEDKFFAINSDLSVIGQILAELTGRLRQMRTALWACMQLLNWNTTPSYAHTVKYLTETSSHSLSVQSAARNCPKLSQIQPLMNIVKPLKSVARPLMDFQMQMDRIHFPQTATATGTPVHQIHNNNNSNKSNNNKNHNSTQHLLFLPGAVNAAGLCWSQRNVQTPSARPIFTQSAQYLSDQVFITEAGLFASDPNGTVQSSNPLFPHPAVQPGQPTLIMPSTLFTGNFNPTSGLGPQLCRFQPGNRYPDRL